MTGPHLTPEREAERIARAFHEAYERLAPSFGYETRTESAVPWEDVPENNRQLMVAVAAEVVGPAIEALNQARTALDDSSVLLVRVGLRLRVLAPHLDLIGRIDAQVQANQVARGLAVAEADKPHDGNER